MSSSPIARAIAELETERENLTARLAKLDAAIATMRDLFHLPSNGQPRKLQPVPVRHDASSSSTKGGQVKDAIRAALKGGPLETAELATKLKVNKPKAAYYVRQLVAAGDVKLIGAGRASKVALAGTPAKEAP